jgi:hypothetical protein
VENYEEKEKIVKVEDIGVDDAGSMRFHNMLLDLVQYNNIEIPTKTLKSTSILKEYIQPCTFLLQTLKAYLYMDTLKFTLRKTWKGVLVCCKNFHFQQNFFGEIKIIKKKKKTALGWWHSKQAANMLFCTRMGTQVALASKEVGRRPSPDRNSRTCHPS